MIYRRGARLLVLASASLGACDDATDPIGLASEASLHTSVASKTTGLAYPVYGTTSEGGKFRGTFTITGVGWNPQIGPELRAVMRGAVTGPSSSSLPLEQIDFQFVPIEHEYEPQSPPNECVGLRVNFGTIVIPSTKLAIHLEPLRLAPQKAPGPGNLLRDVLCISTGASYEFDTHENV